MTDKSNTQAADWLHLKPYGYAPGNYMSKCFGCKRVLPNLDKMASRCRPCAEALAAQPTPEPVAQALLCPSCGADRFKEPCKGDLSKCSMAGEAQGAPSPVAQAGCDYCQHPLFAGTKCKNCGRVPVAQQGWDDEQARLRAARYMELAEAGMKRRGDAVAAECERMLADARTEASRIVEAARASLPAGGVVEPFGKVTVKRVDHPNHTPIYTFYPWPQPPYLDNVQECHTVYLGSQPPATQGRRQMTKADIEHLWAFHWTGDREAFVRAIEARLGIPASPQDGGEQA